MSFPSSSVPIDYTTPPFPSLYWPIRAAPGTPCYLYYTTDIWRFTLYWSLITFGLTHALVAAWAVLMQLRSAMTQRGVLRRSGAKGTTRGRARPAPARTTTGAAGDGAGDGAGGGEDVASQRSGGRGSETRSSVEDGDGDGDDGGGKGSHLPQPLLVSTSPVLSTLGWVWIIPVVYLTIGGLEALLSGSLVGLIIGAVYNAGYFKMSTWMPFLWGLINCLVVILGSFRIQGGL